MPGNQPGRICRMFGVRRDIRCFWFSVVCFPYQKICLTSIELEVGY
jgi:hypothetical protein